MCPTIVSSALSLTNSCIAKACANYLIRFRPFETADIEEKMDDMNTDKPEPNAAPYPDAAANDAAAREHGWAKPVSYNYGMYNAPFNPSRPGGEGEANEGEAGAEGARPQYTEDVPEWGAKSARYEWKEEYGDVGPAFKPLEDMLFGTQLPEKAEYFNE